MTKHEVELRLEVSPQQLDLLEQLVATGLFGLNVEACAEELLRARLRELLLEGAHQMGANRTPPPRPPRDPGPGPGAGDDPFEPRPKGGKRVDPALSAKRRDAAKNSWRPDVRERRMQTRMQTGMQTEANRDAKPPAPPFCTSDAVGTSAPSLPSEARTCTPANGASLHACKPANGETGKRGNPEPAAAPGSEEGLQALVACLVASPFERLVPAKYRVPRIATAAASLHASRITPTEVRYLQQLAKALPSTKRPEGLWADWIRAGGACCRMVIDDQGRKKSTALALLRADEAARVAPADQVARGEHGAPAFGTAPLLAGSVLAQLQLPLRTGGGSQ